MPRLLYHFQALPVCIPASFLKAVNKTFVRFVWAQKPPRVAQTTLRLPKLRGGIALPDANLYLMACHLTRILDWCRHSTLKQWVQIEYTLAGTRLESLPWCHKPMPNRIIKHPTVGETWQTACKVFRDFLVAPLPSPLTPIVGNPAFAPGLDDPRFLQLLEVERSQARHFIDGQWKNRQQITEDPALAGLSFWQKIQLTHFIGSLPTPELFEIQLTTFELLCVEQTPLRHAISLTYQLLLDQPQDFRLLYISKWEKDLGVKFTEKQIDRLFLFAHKISVCARHQEAGYKLLARWYYAPEKIHQMFPQSSNLCWRCGEETGSLLHVFWSCRTLRPFWTEYGA